MKATHEFMEIGKYGKLKMDKIIFEAAYPILFTCVNEKDELFACVCCQNNDKGKKWLVSRTTPATVVRMLRDEMTIRDVLLENADCRITINRFDGKTDVRYNDKDDWAEESIYLPKKGERLEAEPNEFDEEIAYYLNKKANAYIENYKYIFPL